MQCITSLLIFVTNKDVHRNMEKHTIESRIIKTVPIKWRELEFLQPENFKEWIEKGDIKLTNSILKYQFIDPFKVWEHEGKLYCLDGRHRFMDLNFISNTPGSNVPELLPATFINCENMQEAAELVLVYSSAYAKITEQGLEDFTANFNLNLPELENLINLPSFEVAEEMAAVQYPVDFVAELKDAPPTLKITFDNLKQLDQFEIELKKLIDQDKFSNIKYSISAGEL